MNSESNLDQNLVKYNKRWNTINQCGVILLNGLTDPSVLLVFQTLSQKWGLPKGHLTEKELYRKDYYLCAKRELFEETGIYLSTNKHKYWGTVLLHNKIFYVIQIFKEHIYVNPVDKNEISGYKWYPIFELDEFVKTHNCNRTVRDLLQKMGKYTRPSIKHNKTNNLLEYNERIYPKYDNKTAKTNSEYNEQNNKSDRNNSNINKNKFNKYNKNPSTYPNNLLSNTRNYDYIYTKKKKKYNYF